MTFRKGDLNVPSDFMQIQLLTQASMKNILQYYDVHFTVESHSSYVISWIKYITIHHWRKQNKFSEIWVSHMVTPPEDCNL